MGWNVRFFLPLFATQVLIFFGSLTHAFEHVERTFQVDECNPENPTASCRATNDGRTFQEFLTGYDIGFDEFLAMNNLPNETLPTEAMIAGRFYKVGDIVPTPTYGSDTCRSPDASCMASAENTTIGEFLDSLNFDVTLDELRERNPLLGDVNDDSPLAAWMFLQL